MRYARLYWDLDGTLTDPAEGMRRSLAYALGHLGIELSGQADIRRFVGPPLRDSLRDAFGLEGERLEVAVALYRECYAAVGWRENVVHSGVAALLARLAEAGVEMAVATSKPEPIANRILDHFGLRPYFGRVFGASLDSSRERKRDVLAHAVAGIDARERARAAMVGDHQADVEAARVVGLASIAVAWGYGDPIAIARLRPTHRVVDVAALSALLLAP